jgi:hypothetical protein
LKKWLTFILKERYQFGSNLEMGSKHLVLATDLVEIRAQTGCRTRPVFWLWWIWLSALLSKG